MPSLFWDMGGKQKWGDISLLIKTVYTHKCINTMAYATHLQVEHHYLQNDLKLIVFRKKLRYCILLSMSLLPFCIYFIVISRLDMASCQLRTLILFRLKGKNAIQGKQWSISLYLLCLKAFWVSSDNVTFRQSSCQFWMYYSACIAWQKDIRIQLELRYGIFSLSYRMISDNNIADIK